MMTVMMWWGDDMLWWWCNCVVTMIMWWWLWQRDVMYDDAAWFVAISCCDGDCDAVMCVLMWWVTHRDRYRYSVCTNTARMYDPLQHTLTEALLSIRESTLSRRCYQTDLSPICSNLRRIFAKFFPLWVWHQRLIRVNAFDVYHLNALIKILWDDLGNFSSFPDWSTALRR